MKLAQYLRHIREEKNLSQKDIAKKLGYQSSQFVSNWERGISYPPMDSLAKLVSILGADKTYAFNLYIKELTEAKHKEFSKALKKAR